MAVRVLGPMDTGDTVLGPRERTILAALIVRRGTAVAPAQLAEAWWGESPPPTWAQQIRNSVARIRARLGASAVDTIGTEYRLGVPEDAVDAVRFERLVGDARSLGLRAEDDRAVDTYRRALALWRGPALPELAHWPPGAAEAARLEEIRASAEEELLDARLRAGEHRAVIPEAEQLVTAQPLREDRWAILALARYRTDRQAEALATLRAARAQLADELGIEPGARLSALETAMLRQDPGLDAPPTTTAVSAECPYPGLRSFGPEESELFFGRDADTDALLERLRAGTLLVLAGPSGCGKSSVARAGVIPRLRASGRTVAAMRPGIDPGGELRRTAERASVVVVDQAEELFRVDGTALDAFDAAAAEVLAGGTALLFTLRSDALDAARALPRIGDRLGGSVRLLGALSPEGCYAAIVEPARRAGLRLEAGLVELALRDAGDRSSTLPHLSHALHETWARREGATLTVGGYEASGGIAGAIAQSAEDVYRGLTPHEQEVCRALLLRLIERSGDGVSTRHRGSAARMLAEPDRRAVAERLARARLLSLDADTITVAHEAIATAWPRLDAWLDEDRERGRVMRLIETAAAEWDAAGRGDDELLRGGRLHLATTWREAGGLDLTPLEADFLDAAQARERSAAQEWELRAARERGRNRTLRGVLAGAALLLVAAITAGGIAAVRSVESARSAEDARIEALVATSLSLRSSDRDVAALLAAEAHRRWPDDERVRSALLGIVSDTDGMVARLPFGDVKIAAAALPATRTMLLVRDDADRTVVEVVDIDTWEQVRRIDVDIPPSTTSDLRNLVVSADGSTAAIQTPRWRVAGDHTTCCVNDVVFVDLDRDLVLPGSRELDLRTGSQLLLAPDGSALHLVHPLLGALMRVDTATGELTASDPAVFDDFTGQPGVYDGLAPFADGLIAVTDARGVTLYDSQLAAVRTIPLPIDAGTSVADIGDGTLVASGHGGITRVDTGSAEVRWTRTEQGICYLVTVDIPRDRIYCSQKGHIAVLSLETGTEERRLALQSDDTASVAQLADGRDALFVGSTAAQRWRLDGSGPVSRLVAHDRDLGGAFDTGGATIITVARDEEQHHQVWDLSSDSAVGEPALWLQRLAGDTLERWDGVELSFAPAGDGAPYFLTDPAFGDLRESQGVLAAPPGDTAFLVMPDRLIPVDAATGDPSGPDLVPAGDGMPFALLTVSGSIDGDRAAVTWYDPSVQSTRTTVFDRADGSVVADGLASSEGSLITGTGDLLAVTDRSLTRHRLDTLSPIEAMAKPFGGGTVLSMSDDQRTLMVLGWDNRVSLYGMPAGVRLGDPIATHSPFDAGGAALSPDGRLLATGTPEGVLVWELDPGIHADAACRIAGRELTATEWSTYFADEPQRATCSGSP